MANRIGNVSKIVKRNSNYIKSHNKRVDFNYNKISRIDLSKQNKLDKRRFNKSYNSYRRENIGILFRLLWVVFIVIIFVALFKIARGGENDLSFTGLLDFVSNLNQYDINLSIPKLSIVADWGLFNWLRDFFNLFTSIFGILVWLFSCILSVISYLLQFIRFVLV